MNAIIQQRCKICFPPQVAAIVTQPGKPKGRGNKSTPVPSPVEQLARNRGVPDDLILSPKTAREVSSELSLLMSLYDTYIIS
jgi:methionyl-tRNA formyltransferase